MLDRSLKRRPEWIRHQLPSGKNFNQISDSLKSKGLYTVCEEAKCPNIAECWSKKTATIMILGDTCTRACKFCHVKTGNPEGFINPEEIPNAATMVGLMGLRYVVITSVDRDDLPDHGAGHFASVVRKIHETHPATKVEVLIPDFAGIPEHMHTLAQSNPFVIAQNIETVKRLTHPVRDRRASYERTMEVLKFYKDHYPHITTKSSIMLGLGETETEIIETMQDLRTQGVGILTLGQYLQPSRHHLGVQRFYPPEEFQALKEKALSLGFSFVAAGPMVRSSYKASDYLDYLKESGHGDF